MSALIEALEQLELSIAREVHVREELMQVIRWYLHGHMKDGNKCVCGTCERARIVYAKAEGRA